LGYLTNFIFYNTIGERVNAFFYLFLESYLDIKKINDILDMERKLSMDQRGVTKFEKQT